MSVSKKKDRKIFENDLLNQISLLLFPPLEEAKMEDMEFIVDTSIDSNLQSAISDIQEDEITKETYNSLLDALKRLQQLRELLKVEQVIYKSSQYLIIDTKD